MGAPGGGGVDEASYEYTKTIGVSLWKSTSDKNEMDRLRETCGNRDDEQSNDAGNSIDGYMHLRGEWFHTDCHPGDVLHLCSISGNYVTDPSALPLLLHSHPPAGSDAYDDLVLVMHPDEMISPTLVSEAVKCPRLAVLQSRLGSTGLSAKSAVI